MNPGLKKIIAINSYLSNPVCIFDVEKNTMVSGDNASGKTSFLKLISVFYGTMPQKIAIKTENSVGFADFYLKYPNSFIVFEYVTNLGKVAQSVLSRKDDGVQYRFISKEFDLEDYVQDISAEKWEFLQSKELFARLERVGTTLSPTVPNITTYRRCIQNDNIGKKDSGDKRDREFLKYSLEGGTRSLKHIDAISNSLITGNINFEDIKSLLAQIMQQEGGGYRLDFKPEDAESWLKNHSTVCAFNKSKKKFLETLEKGKRLIELESKAEEKINIAYSISYYLSDKISELAAKITALNSERKEIEGSFNQILGDLHQAKQMLDRDISTKETIVSDIQDKKDQYINDDAEEKVENYNSIPTLNSDLISHKKDLALLNAEYSEVNELENEYASRIDSKKFAIKEENQSHESAIQEVNSNEIIALSSLQSRKDARIAVAKDSLHNLLKDLEEENSATNSEIGILKNSLRYLKGQEFYLEFSKVIESAKQKISDLYSELDGLNEEKSKYDTSSLKEERFDIANKRQALVESFEKIKREMESCEMLAQGKQGSILRLLHDSTEDFSEHPILKVIDKDILIRDDLEPAFSDNSKEHGFFGLHLNVDSLPMPEYLLDIEKKIESLVEQMDKNSADSKALSKRQQEIDALISVNERELKKIDGNIESIKSEISDKKAYVQQQEGMREDALSKETGIIRDEIEKKERSLAKGFKKRDSIKKEHEKDLKIIDEDYLVEKSDIETNSGVVRDKLDGDHALKINNLKHDIRCLEKELVSKRKGMDFDIENYEYKKKCISDLEGKISEYEGLYGYVTDYQNFIKTDIANLPIMVSEIDKLKSEAKVNDANLSKKQNEKTKLISEVEKKKASSESNQEKLETQLKSIKGWLDSVDEKNEPNEVVVDIEKLDISLFIQENDRLREELSQLKKSVERGIAKIETDLISDDLGSIKSTWVNDVSLAGDSRSRLRSQILSFEKIVNDIIPHVSQLLISQAESMAYSIEQYKVQLQQIEREVESLSRKLTKVIDGCANYKNLKEISVRLEPVIHKVGGWDAVKEFCEEFEKWRSGDYAKGELPSDFFRNRLQSVINIKRQSGKEDTKLEDLFDVVFAANENGQVKTARNASQLNRMSSNGLTFVFLSTLFMGLMCVQRGASRTRLHWAVDEIGKLSTENTIRLVEMLDKQNIKIVCALPEAKIDIMGLFTKLYRIENGSLIEASKEPDELDMLLEGEE